MAIRRMTKGRVPITLLGTFHPVGHMVLAFDDEEAATRAHDALLAGGFDADDVLQYGAAEEADLMSRMLAGASQTAGFGYEISLMRRYLELAEQGCGWLVVYAPDQAHADRAAGIARQQGARLAERYGRLMIEDLI